MKKKIIFLESYTKVKTLESFKNLLPDNEYVIFATGGHLWELKKTGVYNLGVDLEKFSPTYEIISKKRKSIAFWRDYLLKIPFSIVYLATDLDREGEAIADEIVKILKIPENLYKRLTFNEITAKSVLNSLKNPLSLDKNLVESQVSRQVLDRMIGFCLSTLLQRRIKAPSAGRIQSVVLKMIVEKEEELKKYEKEKNYILCAFYYSGKEEYILRQKNSDGELIIYDKVSTAEEIKKKLNLIFRLIKKTKEESLIFPKNPLTTSLLLYEAKLQLGFSISKTTKLAQELYEGVWLKEKKIHLSLITYPRTDSSRLNQEFVQQVKKYIIEKWGGNYCQFSSSKSIKKKLNVQDAHEAIRPTYFIYQPVDMKESLSEEQYKLYNLIFTHTIASVMSPAQVTRYTYTFLNNSYYFTMKESITKFIGFFVLSNYYFSCYKVKNKSFLEEKEIDNIEAKKIEIMEYLDKKPRRYNEGNLIQELERLGIGRPSTYSIFSRILLERKYAIYDKKNCFVPTELGTTVNQWLQRNFSFLINEKYTAELEKNLDKVAKGDESYLVFIKRFWENFYSHYRKIENE